MRPQLAIHWPSPHELWSIAPREDSLAAALADRHYSRQTPGADGFLAAGKCVVLYHRRPDGDAVWGVVYNMDPVGAWRFRNTLFHSESKTLSSTLIEAATFVTYREWVRKYGALPAEPLRTEIDVEATKRRRSKRHSPGHCYLMAGWHVVRYVPPGHGRSAKVELEAPR